MEATLERRSGRQVAPKPRGWRLSHLLVRGLSGIGGASKSLVESLRLLAYALFEVDALTRTALGALLSSFGVTNLGGAFERMHENTERQRRWASRTGSQQLHADYRPLPSAESGGLAELRAHLDDPARARDLDWHLLNPVLSAGGAILSWTLVGTGVNTLFVMTSNYYGPAQLLIFALACAQMFAAPLVARLVQGIHRRWVRFMLASAASENLEERVRTLTETRMTALDMQDAEIQRIERDLHDGAQARLVSIGMTVTQAERLMQHDPDATRALLDDVKNDAATALQEIRTLVRGIRPPVLADRGLPDALRALAASHPIDTMVTSRLQGRLLGPVESALFFAASELMTNATKHSSASRIGVQLGESDRDVVVEVFDDGLGGAEGQDVRGGGIDGIRRRLAPFDGTLEVVSPVGGGTFATIRVPRPAS